ncbi:gem-associated protein 8-like [Acipenser oxyrinchus oxyrinchus]|uniref:Gem-associated protein 8-like n=1 Tax=Acipenser oxyrinchus oxyrinchus TaxID=40147 RepID=A0AAD8DEE8_ACIOX|nr:gem-associated protein 8-like [Acipenser oxyrinchus oxyrinchus]
MDEAPHQESDAWYNHQVYSRYWRHYQQAMNWQYRHKQAYRKALEAVYYSPFSPPPPAAPHRYSDWNGDNPSSMSHYSAPRERMDWARQHRRRVQEMHKEELETESESEAESEGDSESDSEIEYDVSNMEITEELRQYFAQTEKHREELKKQQQLDAERQDTYVLADHDLYRVSGRSAQPPVERPGERRMAEMKKLYGEDAAKIQGMETAMQLTFDRNCDKKQPKYWPVIPLKL